MINKKYKYGFIVIIALCIVLLVAGAKFDYAITDKLYNPQNAFCIFFEATSKFPIMASIPVLGACLMVRNRGSMQTFAIGIVMLIAFWCYFCYSAAYEMTERGLLRKANPYLCGILGGLLSAALFLLVRRLKKSTIRKIQTFCAFSMIYRIAYIGSTGALKVLCGRDRYEDIITGGEYAFANWYKPVFFSSGSSFPSGHTAAAMGILVLLIVPFVFKEFKGLEWPIFIVGYSYVFVTGFTRLVMGRHFLSDVAMAVLVMTIAFMVITPVYEQFYRKELVDASPAKKEKGNR